MWKALIFSRCHYACFCLVSLGKHIYLNSALIHFWWNQYAWYRKGIWWLSGMGVRVWSLKEGKNMCHTYLYSLSYLATQYINSVNRVTKCRFTLRRILLCKWSVKMQGNCWLRCHVCMISKPLIQKYIHVCHPDNWNTHNHQPTESLQNIQTHTVHWNAQNSQPIEIPKLPRQLIHPNRPAQGSTQTTQFTEIPWSNPLKHATHLVHWNTLLLHRPLGFYSMKQTISTIPPNRTKQQHMQQKTHKHWMGFNGALKPVPNPPPPLPLSFLPFLLCNI